MIPIRPEGGNLAQLPLPLEFENDDVICCFRAKYPKMFARAFGARIKYPLIKSKAPKNCENFRSCLRHFCQSTRFCPPLEKFLRAPMMIPLAGAN